LKPEPGPCDFDGHAADPLVAGLVDALFSIGPSAVKRCWGEPDQGPDLFTILEIPSGEEFGGEGPCAVDADGAEAVAASMGVPGQVATLILPANTAWEESNGPATPVAPVARPKATAEAIRAAAAALISGEECMLHISDTALMGEALDMAGRIMAKTGCRLSCKTSNRRWERGAGRVPVERIQYPVDIALKQLETVKNLILLGAPIPVAFFAYPNKPSVLIPESCNVVDVAPEGYDLLDALTAIAAELGATDIEPVRQKAEKPALMSGALTPESIAAAIGHLMPKDAIIADESVTSGRGLMPFTAGAEQHDWLSLTGGSIGIGMPFATGAAIACPDRKVICLEGDGSGMYTLQALWTQAREKCNVINVIFANRTYEILKGELMNVGAKNPGRKAFDMLEIGRPDLDWRQLAGGMGVSATRATTAEEFNEQFQRALKESGPHLIEAWM